MLLIYMYFSARPWRLSARRSAALALNAGVSHCSRRPLRLTGPGMNIWPVNGIDVPVKLFDLDLEVSISNLKACLCHERGFTIPSSDLR